MCATIRVIFYYGTSVTSHVKALNKFLTKKLHSSTRTHYWYD
jgi:hypothetical protein